jgi:hypothetical protein
MLRVYTDFNSEAPEGYCWLLLYEGQDLESRIGQLGLGKGDLVLLYQDEDDFEVTAALDHIHVHVLGRDAWIARPDWSTMVRRTA